MPRDLCERVAEVAGQVECLYRSPETSLPGAAAVV